MSSIRLRLALILLLALLPALAVMLHGAAQNRRAHLEAGGARLVQAAKLIAAEHEQLVEGARQLLLALRTAPALVDDRVDRSVCHARLAEVLADASGRYANLLLFDHEGRLLCDAVGTTATFDVADRTYFRQALAGGLPVGPHVVARDATGRPVLPIAMPMPRDGDRSARVLAANLSLDWLGRYDRNLELPTGAAFEVADRAGRVLVSSAATVQVVRQEGPWAGPQDAPRVFTAADRLVGLVSAAGGDLVIAVSAPKSEVTAGPDRLLRLELAGVAVALVLGYGLAAGYGELAVARRLRLLTSFAARLRDGDLSARPPWRRAGADEIGELARVLDHMAGRLERRLDALTASEAEQRRQARHDPLTGLLNRSGYAERLEVALAATRGRDDELALLLLDLDRFKAVNDTLGHAAGDALLVAVANRIRAELREEDDVARLGGDEFAVLLQHRRDGEFAPEVVARRLVKALAQPFTVAGQTVSTGASIGVALFPAHGENREELIEAADCALYAAKRAGRGTWRSAVREEPDLLQRSPELA